MIAIFYILLIVLLHMVPLGGGSVVNRIAVGGLRADYILHALVFLPWMGLGPYRAQTQQTALP